MARKSQVAEENGLFMQLSGRMDRGHTKYHRVLAELFGIAMEEVTLPMLKLGVALRSGFKNNELTKDNITPYEQEFNRIKSTL